MINQTRKLSKKGEMSIEIMIMIGLAVITIVVMVIKYWSWFSTLLS